MKAGTDQWRVSRAFWLIVVVFAWTVVPRILQSIGGVKYKASVGVDGPPQTGLAKAAQYALLVVVLGLCLIIVLESVRRIPTDRGLALIALIAPWLYLWLRDFVLQIKFSYADLVYPLVAVCVWLLRPPLASLATLGYLVGLTAFINIALGFVLPASAIYRSAQGAFITEDKQILPWGILVGIFSQGNNLGQFLVLGIPAVVLIPRRMIRNILLACCLLSLVWSASRSSLFALGASLIAAVLVIATRGATRRAIAWLSLLALMAVVCLLPILTQDPLAFTNRGFIWSGSLAAWTQDEWFGLGANWYTVVGGTSARLAGSVFHGHNQYVQLLVTGGILLAVLVGVLVVVAIRNAVQLADKGSAFGVAFLAAFLGTCTLEVSLVLVDNQFLFAVMVLPLAFILFRGDPHPMVKDQLTDDLRHKSAVVA